MSAILIGAGSLLYTNRLVKDIETTERQKVELWADAIRLVNSANFETDLAFPFSVIESNTNIPVILTDSEGTILIHKNLDSLKVVNPAYLQKQLEHARVENDALVITLGNEEFQYIFRARDTKISTGGEGVDAGAIKGKKAILTLGNARIYNSIGYRAISIDALSMKCAMPVKDLINTLTSLEMEELISEGPSNHYSRCD